MSAQSSQPLSAALRALYGSYGYERFKVQKFERYDLYAAYRSFLESEQILTFTDTDGRLMAMKPDVTLSIVKDTHGTGTRKVYYAENVYREQRRGEGFREIPQLGLECIGEIDDYAVGEVVMLAARSLQAIGGESILDVSHVGVVAGLLDAYDLTEAQRSAIFAAVGAKNAPALGQLCPDPALAQTLGKLVSLYGPLRATLAEARALALPARSRAAMDALDALSAQLEIYALNSVRLDFSVVNDVDYYDDLVFRGFVAGAAQGVLSGGRYDRLLRRMEKSGGALGFAVYLDRLERVQETAPDYDADVLILSGGDAAQAARLAEDCRRAGKTVRVQPTAPEGMRFRETVRIADGEVEKC